MINLIIYILIFYWIYKYIIKASSSAYSLLLRALTIQEFSNISNVYSNSTLAIIRADTKGENYLFGARKDGAAFSVNDIEKLYAIAQGLHIHTVVLATRNPITTTNSIYKKIREYGIDVWDFQKLSALATAQSSANATHSYSVLKTSDTSDDHCKIDPSSFNPIQDEKAAKTSSLFSGLFSKPDRL